MAALSAHMQLSKCLTDVELTRKLKRLRLKHYICPYIFFFTLIFTD